MVTAAVIVVIERDYRCLFIFADMFGNAAVAVVVVVVAAGFRMVKGFSFIYKGTIVMIVIIFVIIIWGAGSARRFFTSKRID